MFNSSPAGSTMIPIIPKFPRRAVPSSLIKMFPWSGQGPKISMRLPSITSTSYRSNVIVDDAQRMQMFEASGGLCELPKVRLDGPASLIPVATPTSCNRSASRLLLMYRTMLPFGNQGLIMQNGNSSETPRRGSTFGCLTYFQTTISR